MPGLQNVELRLDIVDASPARLVSRQALATVHARDFWTCRCCGLRARRHQQVLVENGNWHDVDAMITVCVLCQQCFSVELAAEMRSGVLIECPDLSQAEINLLAAEIYVAQTLPDKAWAGRASSCLDVLLAGRAGARAVLGDELPGALVQRLRGCASNEERLSAERELKPIRLLPVNRRIVREAGLEFNQWPQILAYWRSADGPFPLVGGRTFPRLRSFVAQ